MKNTYLSQFYKIHKKGAYTLTDQSSLRYHLVKKYAWAVPTKAVINKIASFKDIIEIGAGTGYWAALIAQAGAEIVAFDRKPHKNHYCNGSFYKIRKGGPMKVREYPKHTLFLCWPPYDEPMAASALRYYKGSRFLYIGEGEGGCNGDREFWRLLHKFWEEVVTLDIPQWFGLHDRFVIYGRMDKPNKEEFRFWADPWE